MVKEKEGIIIQTELSKRQDLEPDLNMTIDCFQDLLLIQLKNMGRKIELTSSVWPWRFYELENKTVRNYYFLSPNTLRDIFCVELVEKQIDQNNILSSVKNELINNAIIINVDQFYISHHYRDIYQKSHGPHSLMLLDYLDSDIFIGLGVAPKYKGKIDKMEIIDGILNFPKDNKGYMSYFYLSQSVGTSFKSDEDIYKGFLIDIERELYRNSIFHDNILGRQKGTEINLHELFNRIDREYKKGMDSFKQWFQPFSEAQWYWNIDRPGKCLYAYVKTEFFQSKYKSKDYDMILDKIEQFNHLLIRSFRFLYKSYITTKEKPYRNAIEMFNQILTLEESLKKNILNEIK